MFPDFEEEIINDPEMKSIFDVLTTANDDGYSSINLVVGSDRQAEFESLAQKYNGDLYDFDLIRVVSAGARDADAPGLEGMSASKLRKAAADDDYETFKRGIPKKMNDGDAITYLSSLRQIAVWSGMMILIFTLNRPNIWPTYDKKKTLDIGLLRAISKNYKKK